MTVDKRIIEARQKLVDTYVDLLEHNYFLSITLCTEEGFTCKMHRFKGVPSLSIYAPDGSYLFEVIPDAIDAKNLAISMAEKEIDTIKSIKYSKENPTKGMEFELYAFEVEGYKQFVEDQAKLKQTIEEKENEVTRLKNILIPLQKEIEELNKDVRPRYSYSD